MYLKNKKKLPNSINAQKQQLSAKTINQLIKKQHRFGILQCQLCTFELIFMILTAGEKNRISFLFHYLLLIHQCGVG